MSVLKQLVDSSSNFASLFIIITHDSSVNFTSINFLLWMKGSHQSSNLEVFKCSGLKFAIFLMSFLRIFYHSLVSWNVITLDFFRSNVVYFDKRNQSKCKFWKFPVLRSNFIKFLSFLKQKISFSWNFTSIFSVMRHKSSTYFWLKFYILSTERAHQSTNWVKFNTSRQFKVWKFSTLMGLLSPKYLRF